MAKSDIDYVWTDKKRPFLGLPLSFTRYYLTPTKFITRTGLFSVDEDEIDLYKITDKRITRTFGQRLFGCGTIIISSKDVDTPTKEVISIKCVRQVATLIDKYANAMRDKYGTRGKDMLGGSFHSHYDHDNDYDDDHGHHDIY